MAKRLENLETKLSETICIEITISKKKLCALFAYRPPKQNETLFLEELSRSLSHIVNRYDNYIIAGYLDINMLDLKCDGNSHFYDLKDTYNLSNLVKSATCFKSSKYTLLDVFSLTSQKLFKRPLFGKLD